MSEALFSVPVCLTGIRCIHMNPMFLSSVRTGKIFKKGESHGKEQIQ